MTSESGPEVIFLTFVLLSGAGAALALMLSQHQWPRSDQNREQQLCEMARDFRVLLERLRSPEALTQHRSRAACKPGASR
jgi:hypothetical protein